MVCGCHVACEESLISVSVYGDTLNAKWRLKINGLKQLVCLNTSWTWRTASQFLVFKTVKNAFTLFNILLMWALRWLYFVLYNFFLSYSIGTALLAFAFSSSSSPLFSLILYIWINVSVFCIDLWTWISIYLCKLCIQTVNKDFGGFYSGSSDMFS